MKNYEQREKNNKQLGKELYVDCDVRSILALSGFYESIDEFNVDVKKLYSGKHNKIDIRIILNNLSKNKIVFGARDIKEFYEKYSWIDNIIKNYSNGINISDFLDTNYDEKGNIKKSSGIEFFKNYYIKHNSDKKRITNLLDRLLQLGFDVFTFNENTDYINKEYCINMNEGPSSFNYFDNMEYISYDNEKGDYKYQSKKSDYLIQCIDAGIHGFYKIDLNNLLFDPTVLPKKLEYDTLLNNILGLRISTIENKYENINSIINDMNQQNMHDELQKLKSYLTEMQKIISTYDTRAKTIDSDISTKKVK